MDLIALALSSPGVWGLLAVLTLILGMSWLTDDSLVKNLMALGILNSSGKFGTTIKDAAPTQALSENNAGQTFVGLVDAVFTLPKAVANRGLSYTFVCGALSAGTGLSISPNALDFIGGYGLTVVINKDLINSGATDVVGDQVTVTENAAGTGWLATNKLGTWAKEP